jgi:hypothetical protein
MPDLSFGGSTMSIEYGTVLKLAGYRAKAQIRAAKALLNDDTEGVFDDLQVETIAVVLALNASTIEASTTGVFADLP